MVKKNIENKIKGDFNLHMLRAMSILSKDMGEGIEYAQFGEFDLIQALDKLTEVKMVKISKRQEKKPTHYKLTQKGITYFNKIMRFAKQEYLKL